MDEKIDLDDMTRRTRRLITEDGLMELLMGLIMFVTSASIKGPSFTVFLSLYVVFLKQILEGFRKRFTYPRIGYVKMPDDDDPKIGLGILAYFGTVLILSAFAIYLTYGGFTTQNIYRWLPAAMGLTITGGLKYNLDKTGDRVNAVYILVSLLGGFVFPFLGFSDPRLGVQLYFLSLSGFFIAAGVYRMATFRRNHPVQRESP